MKKNILVLGANSEFAESFIELTNNTSHEVFGISREKVQNLSKQNQIVVSNYLDNMNEIINFIKKINNPYIIFFNGFLRENRPESFPSELEIEQTVEINYLIPLHMTQRLKEVDIVDKFIYISTMASIKPRFKNYVYGLSKKSLEESVKNIESIEYLIVRYGQIDTNMSKNHSKAPFSLNKIQASKILLKLIDSRGLKHANTKLLLVSILIKILPLKLLNYIENRR
tara:strand:- start:147 stop:824 length:678 start_codon:yes stop_codon:yes gene_type:complete